MSGPPRAGIVPRLAALGLDVAGLAVLVVAASVVLVRVGAIVLDDGVIDPLAIAWWWAAVHPGLLAAVPIASAFASWAILGATPGQLLVGCRVTRVDDGAAPGPLRALVRVVVAVLGLVPLGIGIVRVAWDPARRGWHDYAAGTAVTIEDESYLSLADLETRVR